jgi:hypothetical protein
MNLSASNINLSATNMSFRGRTDINTIGSANTNIGTGTNTGTITIGNAASTGLNIGEPMTPTYLYNSSTTGTNIDGTIGYMYFGTYTAGTGVLGNNTTTTSSTISINKNGVYLITYSQGIKCTNAGTISRWVLYFQPKNDTNGTEGNYGLISQFGPSIVTNHYLAGSYVYVYNSIVSGSPWTANLVYEFLAPSGNYSKTESGFSFIVTKIA